MDWQAIKCWCGFHGKGWEVTKNKADGFAQKICKYCHATTNKITIEEFKEYWMKYGRG